MTPTHSHSHRQASPSLVRYAWLSVATSILVLALKFGAWWATDSVGLLSDAMETGVNLAAALAALAALTYAAAAPDAEHNFGHAKAEYFSSGLEGALIFVAAVAIAVSVWPRLAAPVPLHDIGVGVVLSVAAALANAGCALVLLKAARAHHSITLEADAKHLLTDVWTTVGVLAGLALAWATGWHWLDPLIALAVALHILVVGWDLLSRSFNGLMDGALPPDECAAIVQVLESFKPRGMDYHALRTRQSGRLGFVDVHILVPGQLSVREGHDLLEEIEAAIRAAVPRVEVLTHLEPLEDPRAWEDTSGTPPA